MGDFNADVSDTAFDFQRVVWPAIIRPIGGGELIHIESETAKGLTQKLDIHAGIDAWQIIKDDSIVRGVASRIQWGDKDWSSFTIRKSRDSGAKTEFRKRLEAIRGDRGAVYPHLTVQAYVSKRRTGDLVSVAIVKTEDLFLLAEHLDSKCSPNGKWGIRRAPNAEFIWLDWALLKDKGAAIKIIRGNT